MKEELRVIAVNADPGHVRTSRPPSYWRGNTNTVVRMKDVDRPQPGYVVGSQRTKKVNNMPPSSHKYGRRRVPVAPRVPSTVHLMPEAEDDRVIKGANSLSVGLQVAVILPGRNRGEANVSRIHLHEWHRTMLGSRRSESHLERLEPATVVWNHVRLDSRRCRERGNPCV